MFRTRSRLLLFLSSSSSHPPLPNASPVPSFVRPLPQTQNIYLPSWYVRQAHAGPKKASSSPQRERGREKDYQPEDVSAISAWGSVRWLTRWHPVGWSMRSASGRLAVVRLIPSVASPAAPPCASSAAATLVRSLVRSHACSFARSQLTRDFSLVRVFRRWNPDALGQQVRVSQ